MGREERDVDSGWFATNAREWVRPPYRIEDVLRLEEASELIRSAFEDCPDLNKASFLAIVRLISRGYLILHRDGFASTNLEIGEGSEK